MGSNHRTNIPIAAAGSPQAHVSLRWLPRSKLAAHDQAGSSSAIGAGTVVSHWNLTQIPTQIPGPSHLRRARALGNNGHSRRADGLLLLVVYLRGFRAIGRHRRRPHHVTSRTQEVGGMRPHVGHGLQRLLRVGGSGARPRARGITLAHGEQHMTWQHSLDEREEPGGPTISTNISWNRVYDIILPVDARRGASRAMAGPGNVCCYLESCGGGRMGAGFRIEEVLGGQSQFQRVPSKPSVRDDDRQTACSQDQGRRFSCLAQQGRSWWTRSPGSGP